MIHFAAAVLGKPLDPWQQWLVIHAGEMLDDGRPRFRQVLVIVARQNGKTHLCQVLALFWMFVERWPIVFGTSTTLEQARKAWAGAVMMAEKSALSERLDKQHKRVGNGQQDFWNLDGSHYLIGAVSPKGGRGDSIDRAIGDELREQRSWEGYQAAYYAMSARPAAQVVYITNMGDARAIVLNSLRQDALDDMGREIERPVALFEWSAPPGSHPMDYAAHAAANPQYGRRNHRDDVLGEARSVSKPGADPEKLTGFLTEVLCMTVDRLDPAIDPAAWAGGRRPAAIDTSDRTRVAACVDVSPDQQHATLAVAALEDDKVRVELVHSWDGVDALARCLADLPEWIARIRPRQLAWFPGGPAATLDAALRDRRARGGRAAWPPRGVLVHEIGGAEAPAVCMGFAERIGSGALLHSGQDLLDVQVGGAGKLWTGDRWVFERQGGGHVDAVYAAAGAAHTARTMLATRKVSRSVHTL